jgi:hypothetical protein
LVAADFNGDRRPDLAVARSNSSSIAVLLNNGHGLGSATEIPVGHKSWTVTAGDLNRDGHTDLVATNGDFRATTVIVALGIGNGTFGAPHEYTAEQVPFAVGIADFNGDKIPDLAVADCCWPAVSVLLGVGDGTFRAATDYFPDQNPTSIGIGDFNGDRNLDIATTNEFSDSVSLLLGNGHGSFSPVVNLSVGPAGSEPFALSTLDANHDHTTDFVVANYGSGTLREFTSTR